MIDNKLIQLLDSDDVETRMKAVKALARTNSKDALPHLARVIKHDSDEDVRELARKAGIYIHKNLPAQPTAALDDDDEDDERPDLLPSQIKVTPAEEERAQSYMGQAMDWHTRGDNAKAAQFIQRALKLNPRLIYDEYSRSFASTVTGLDADIAMRQLAPGKAEMRKKAIANAPQRSSGLQGFLAILLMVAAAVALVGYFLLPWLDMSTLPSGEDLQGQPVMLRESIDTLNAEFADEQAQQGLALILGEEAANDIINAFADLKLDFTGLDVTLLAVGAQDIFQVMGLDVLYDGLAQIAAVSGVSDDGLPEVDYTPEPLDYSLPLIPVMGFLSLIVGLAAIVRPTGGKWVLGIVFGLVGLLPLLYFYLSAVNSLLPDDAELFETGEIAGVDLIVNGFWVTLAGMLLVLALGFIGALTLPNDRA